MTFLLPIRRNLPQHTSHLSFLLLVRVRLQRPAQLFVPLGFRWLARPGERGHCQQHPSDNQVKRKKYSKQNVFFVFPIQCSVMWVSCLLRSCNRSLEVDDTDEGSTSPSSTGPASRNNSFRERLRNQSVPFYFSLLCVILHLLAHQLPASSATAWGPDGSISPPPKKCVLSQETLDVGGVVWWWGREPGQLCDL